MVVEIFFRASSFLSATRVFRVYALEDGTGISGGGKCQDLGNPRSGSGLVSFPAKQSLYLNGAIFKIEHTQYITHQDFDLVLSLLVPLVGFGIS